MHFQNVQTLIKKVIIFVQNPNSRQKWIETIGIPDWKSSKSALLCVVGTKACIQMFYNVTPVNINKNNINVIISLSISIY